MDKDLISKVRNIIESNIYCTIATSTKDGNPWISPVFFGYDENYNIYWVSDKNSKHSRLIRDNPKVAIVIFNSQAIEGDGDGVYMEAEVVELEDEKEIEQGYKIRDQRVKVDTFKVKTISEVTGEGAWRVYRATPSKAYKLTEGEYINGQYVDKRIEIKLR